MHLSNTGIFLLTHRCTLITLPAPIPLLVVSTSVTAPRLKSPYTLAEAGDGSHREVHLTFLVVSLVGKRPVDGFCHEGRHAPIHDISVISYRTGRVQLIGMRNDPHVLWLALTEPLTVMFAFLACGN